MTPNEFRGDIFSVGTIIVKIGGRGKAKIVIIHTFGALILDISTLCF